MKTFALVTAMLVLSFSAWVVHEINVTSALMNDMVHEHEQKLLNTPRINLESKNVSSTSVKPTVVKHRQNSQGAAILSLLSTEGDLNVSQDTDKDQSWLSFRKQKLPTTLPAHLTPEITASSASVTPTVQGEKQELLNPQSNQESESNVSSVLVTPTVQGENQKLLTTPPTNQEPETNASSALVNLTVQGREQILSTVPPTASSALVKRRQARHQLGGFVPLSNGIHLNSSIVITAQANQTSGNLIVDLLHDDNTTILLHLRFDFKNKTIKLNAEMTHPGGPQKKTFPEKILEPLGPGLDFQIFIRCDVDTFHVNFNNTNQMQYRYDHAQDLQPIKSLKFWGEVTSIKQM